LTKDTVFAKKGSEKESEVEDEGPAEVEHHEDEEAHRENEREEYGSDLGEL
jgi:hypothetical protein